MKTVEFVHFFRLLTAFRKMANRDEQQRKLNEEAAAVESEQRKAAEKGIQEWGDASTSKFGGNISTIREETESDEEDVSHFSFRILAWGRAPSEILYQWIKKIFFLYRGNLFRNFVQFSLQNCLPLEHVVRIRAVAFQLRNRNEKFRFRIAILVPKQF